MVHMSCLAFGGCCVSRLRGFLQRLDGIRRALSSLLIPSICLPFGVCFGSMVHPSGVLRCRRCPGSGGWSRRLCATTRPGPAADADSPIETQQTSDDRVTTSSPPHKASVQSAIATLSPCKSAPSCCTGLRGSGREHSTCRVEVTIVWECDSADGPAAPDHALVCRARLDICCTAHDNPRHCLIVGS
jgi:hypothetical protein